MKNFLTTYSKFLSWRGWSDWYPSSTDALFISLNDGKTSLSSISLFAMDLFCNIFLLFSSLSCFVWTNRFSRTSHFGFSGFNARYLAGNKAAVSVNYINIFVLSLHGYVKALNNENYTYAIYVSAISSIFYYIRHFKAFDIVNEIILAISKNLFRIH